MGKELSTVLLKLSHDVAGVVRDNKKNGRISKVKRPWVRKKITGFEYYEGSITFTESSSEEFEKEEWDWRVHALIRSEIENLPSYVEACDSISNIYNMEKEGAGYPLGRFVDHIIDKALDEDIGEEYFRQIITTFLTDLEKNPVVWDVVAEIGGLWLKDEEIELTEGVKLRRPKPSDLEFERPFELLSEPFPESTSMFTSAIMEISQKAKSQPDLWVEVEKLIIALRLYKLGSVIKGKVKSKPRSILRWGGITGHGIQPIVYEYALSSEDTYKIPSFLGKIKPLLPLSKSGIEPTDYISISLQRYNDALFKRDLGERITYAIMGLEALFLKSSERGELAHRLAQRVAKCFSILGHQPLEVYKIVKQSYDIRSKFIHGSLVGEKNGDASKLADKIIEYLRISIIMFLESKRTIGKENFLNIVDDSLLHPDVQAKLENLIERCELIRIIHED